MAAGLGITGVTWPQFLLTGPRARRSGEPGNEHRQRFFTLLGHTVKQRKLTQFQVARLMGLDQPKVSPLVNGRLAGFSSDRLMRFLAALGQDVEIGVKPRSPRRDRGQVRVKEA